MGPVCRTNLWDRQGLEGGAGQASGDQGPFLLPEEENSGRNEAAFITKNEGKSLFILIKIKLYF